MFCTAIVAKHYTGRRYHAASLPVLYRWITLSRAVAEIGEKLNFKNRIDAQLKWPAFQMGFSAM
jgi:hypothetical protein